jgi:hypothetical protein
LKREYEKPLLELEPFQQGHDDKFGLGILNWVDFPTEKFEAKRIAVVLILLRHESCQVFLFLRFAVSPVMMVAMRSTLTAMHRMHHRNTRDSRHLLNMFNRRMMLSWSRLKIGDLHIPTSTMHVAGTRIAMPVGIGTGAHNESTTDMGVSQNMNARCTIAGGH